METEQEQAERMSVDFAVFNCHMNNAKKRADEEFIAQFGREKFDKVMGPIHRKGIMSIFHKAPTKYTMAWVVLCVAFVNENRQSPAPSGGASPTVRS